MVRLLVGVGVATVRLQVVVVTVRLPVATVRLPVEPTGPRWGRRRLAVEWACRAARRCLTAVPAR
jgi:hypothetical protein